MRRCRKVGRRAGVSRLPPGRDPPRRTVPYPHWRARGPRTQVRVTVGMPVTGHPPYRPRRAELPHRVPASGQTHRRWSGQGW